MKFCNLPHSLILYLFSANNVPHECHEYLASTSLDGVYGVTGKTYFVFFLLTATLEAPVYWYFVKDSLRTVSKFTAVVLVLNLCTHPLAILGFPQFFALAGFTKLAALWATELFAPTVEGLVLWQVLDLPPKTSFLAALAANLFSWELGGLLAALL
ncbi:MAG: hypothetical protein KDD51_16570 [Bdellovibrionales bacterium]|nr:hypothetical protein [Bdellovibrionales bacterium]